jgi:CRISPR type III-A-associated RAMP protein Csm4
MRLPGILVKFRPAGPWRFGPDNGARDRVEVIGHSDTVYSAVCSAMAHLGELEPWLAATATAAAPAVRFSSLFPFQGRTLFAPPPQHLWPPALAQRLRFRSARFAPLALIQDLVQDQPLREERWEVDGVSGCVLNSGGQSPFRETLRRAAGVDRLTGAAIAHETACIEFNQNCGLWLAVEFASPEAAATWRKPVEAALRWLGDTGLGGERSRGWGRSDEIDIQGGHFPDLLLPATNTDTPATGYWLLSLYSPAETDTVDWDRGDYRLTVRQGRVDQGGTLKRSLRMIAEGSVVLANTKPQGMAHNVAPAGFAHPVYRAGFPLAIALPWKSAEDRPLAPLAETTRPVAAKEEAPAPEPAPAEAAPLLETPLLEDYEGGEGI